jgi:uncharacterized membrane protein
MKSIVEKNEEIKKEEAKVENEKAEVKNEKKKTEAKIVNEDAKVENEKVKTENEDDKVDENKNSKKIKELSNSISEKTEFAKKEISNLTKKVLKTEDKNINKLKDEYYKTIDKADEIKEEIVIRLEEKVDKQESSKGIRILGIKVWRIMAYFVIYSFLGFVLETIYGLLTKGVIESRQSFLYGPFCSIYGLGAVVMILLLQYFKKNNYTLFFGGYVIGSLIEYFVSLFGEMILHVKWWDYSTEPFNINGRVCLFYSLAWGILAIYLVKHVNPAIDSFIDKIKKKLPKYLLPIVFDIGTAFLLADCIISVIAMNVFYARLVYNYNLNIPNAAIYEKEYEEILSNEKWNDFTEKHFSNEKMLKTYPNLKMEDVDGNIIYIKNILNDIKPYYFKCFTPKNDGVRFTNVETVNYEE